MDKTMGSGPVEEKSSVSSKGIHQRIFYGPAFGRHHRVPFFERENRL
jgi:hypothetical protein